MDFGFDQFDADATNLQGGLAGEGPGRQDQRIDGGWAVESGVLDAFAVPRHMGEGLGVGDHWAAREDFRSGDVVQVPMRQNHSETGDPQAFQVVADRSCVIQRDMGVIDQRVIAVVDGIGRDTEFEGTFVDPVRAGHEAMARNSPVIVGQDPRRGGQNPQGFWHHSAAILITGSIVANTASDRWHLT